MATGKVPSEHNSVASTDSFRSFAGGCGDDTSLTHGRAARPPDA
jgi:hypothetical protein